MTDRATAAFAQGIQEVADKLAARKRPPGAVPDAGITQQQVQTRRVNQGRPRVTSAAPTQEADDERAKKVMPGQPASTWRSDKVAAEDATAREFLLALDTNPLTYVSTLTKKYGKDWLEWEPETLWETLRKDYQTYPNDEAKNKMMAVKAVWANDYFWQEWEVFEKVCSAFNGRIPTFSHMEDISVGEMALTVTLVQRLKHREFQPEVQAYAASRAHEDGYATLPEPLAFAQGYLDTLMQGTPGEAVRDALQKTDPLKLEVTDENNPVHVQAGMLQAVAKYVADNDKVEVEI